MVVGVKNLKNMPTALQAWVMAARPRALPIPTIQVLIGTVLAYVSVGQINGVLFLFTWLVAVLITMATHFINDVFDFDNGGNALKRVGHLKVICAGYLSRRQVFMGGVLTFACALLCSIPLALEVGWVIFFLTVLSVICGYCYTAGPYPISYLGLSELFILVFYGGVCVNCAFFVQTGFINGASMLLAMQMGMLAILPNVLNNFRDIFEDAQSKKMTLAVRFGKYFARCEIAAATFLPFIFNMLWLVLGYPAVAFTPLLLAPLAFLFVRSIWKAEPSAVFNRYFMLGVLIHFMFGVLLAVGMFIHLYAFTR